MTRLRFKISQSYSQPQGVPAEAKSIPSLLRRRMSPFARIYAESIYQVSKDLVEGVKPSYVLVTTSGETGRYVNMLEDVVVHQLLSPMTFSTSSLSTTGGQIAIAFHNESPQLSLYGRGSDSFGSGLLESIIQVLDKPLQPVALVYADTSIADLYKEETGEVEASTMGLLLEHPDSNQSTMDGTIYQMELREHHQPQESATELSSSQQVTSFMQLLQGQLAESTITCGYSSWSIRRGD